MAGERIAEETKGLDVVRGVEETRGEMEVELTRGEEVMEESEGLWLSVATLSSLTTGRAEEESVIDV